MSIPPDSAVPSVDPSAWIFEMPTLNFPDLAGTVWTVDIFTNNIKMENQHRTLLLLEIGEEDKETLRL